MSVPETQVGEPDAMPAPPETPEQEPPEEPPVAGAPGSRRGGMILGFVAAVVVVAVAVAGFLTIRSLSEDVGDLEDEVAELERRIAADEAAIADAEQRSDDLEAQADDLASRLAAAEASGAAPVDQASPAIEPAAIAGALPPFQGNGQPDAAIGSPIPDISGVDHLTGEAVAVAEGSPTMVMVWAHWCPYCQQELPEVQALYEAGVFADNGVDLVTIATFEDEARGNPFEEIVDGFTFPVIRDDEDRAALLGLGGVPSWVIVDADGLVIGRFSGAFGADTLLGIVEQVGADAAG